MNTDPPLQSSEETQTPQVIFDTVATDAQRAFHSLLSQDDLTQYIVHRGLDPKDPDRPVYWKAVADFVRMQAQKAQDQGEGINIVFVLLAMTPDFIYTQDALTKARYRHDRELFLEMRRRAIQYNDVVGEVAQAFPGLHASALRILLVETAEANVTRQMLRDMVPGLMNGIIRGAQHESAFIQLLEQTGRAFRKGSVDQDAHGIDLIVESRRGEMRIDVKSSLHEIVKRGEHHHVYTIDHGDGLVTMYSLLTDDDLNDSFHVDQHTVEKKSRELENILEEIETGRRAELVSRPIVIDSRPK